MKKLMITRFELVFSLSLIAIMALPPIVFAQSSKNIQIEITNGDTVINGKDIKKLTPDERKEALGEINKIGNITFDQTGKDGKRNIVIRRNRMMRGGKADDGQQRHMFGNTDNASSPYTMDFYNNGDTARRTFRLRLHKLRGGDSTFAFNFDEGDDVRLNGPKFRENNGPMRFRLESPGRGNDNMRFRLNGPNGRGDRFTRFDRKNTQSFNYAVTDNDGISTHISFQVMDASEEDIRKIAGTQKTGTTITDLNFSPEFSTGKTLISFNLSGKAAADVKLTDSEGKTLWSDKTTGGSFMKKANLPRNGVYFLVVKQGGAAAVKRIVKEN